jgi:hypothetical protein
VIARHGGAPPWRVQEATPEQRRELLRVEEDLFGRDTALRAPWLFDANPAGKALVLVALTERTEIAGTRALLPWRLRVDGREVLVGQYSRTWTLPRFRNQGVSVAIGRALNARSADLGYPMVFLFPSVRSLPGHRILGNAADTMLERRQIPASLKFLWSRSPRFLDGWLRRARILPGGRRGRRDTWVREPSLETATEALERAPDPGERVAGVRDAAFVRWRYSPESGRRYTGWRFPATGAPRLLAVTHLENDRARILDVWGATDRDTTAAALRGLIETLAGEPVRLVEWCPPGFGTWPKVAARAGLLRRRTGVPLARWFNRIDPGLEALNAIETYRLTEGDSDYA